jgi:microcystin-dependent protein
MSDQFLAEIRIFPMNFAPYGWQLCNGQILAISQFAALFSLIGTYYGGNGTSNFQLPNLQANVALGAGNGPGLSSYVIGEVGGVPNVTLKLNEMASHSHSFSADPVAKKELSTVNGATPAGSTLGNFYSTVTPSATMNAVMLTTAGGGGPHENRQSYLAMNFCIALQGLFPSRN